MVGVERTLKDGRECHPRKKSRGMRKLETKVVRWLGSDVGERVGGDDDKEFGKILVVSKGIKN